MKNPTMSDSLKLVYMMMQKGDPYTTVFSTYLK